MKSRNQDSSENAPDIDYNQFIIDLSDKGKWKGYTKFNQIGTEIPRTPQYIEVTPKEILIKESHLSDKVTSSFDLIYLDWVCQTDLPCSPENYLSI